MKGPIMTQPLTPPVEQVDREAAAEFLGFLNWRDAQQWNLNVEAIRLAKAFARHRHSTRQPEHATAGREMLERFDAHRLAIADRRPSAKRDELLSELDTIRNSMCRAALSADAILPGREEIARALRSTWTNFLDANPDDLTSPEDLPDHALMTGEQFEEWALTAFEEADAILARQRGGEEEPYDKASLRRAEDRVISEWKKTREQAERADFGEVLTRQPISTPLQADAVARAREGVQPLETAPKDDSYYLLIGSNFDGGAAVVHWDDGFEWWTLDDGKNPEIMLRGEGGLIGWMPLPVEIAAALTPAQDGEERG